MILHLRTASVVCLFATGALSLFGQKSTTADAMTLLARCQQCHGEKLAMANLSLASREAMLKGGDHGPAVAPGNGAASLLYQRISGQIQPAMPLAPLPRLTAAEIATIKEWIDAGDLQWLVCPLPRQPP